MRWSKGASQRYKLVTRVSGFSQPSAALTGTGAAVFTGALKVVVQDVSGTTASVTVESGPFSFYNRSEALPKTVSTQQVSELGIAKEPGEFLGPQFPKESVRIGSKWNGTDPLAGSKSVGVKANTAYRLLSVRTVAGRRVADISYASIPGAGPMSASGKLVVDVATGRLINAAGTYDFVDSQAGPTRTLRMDISMVRA